MSLPDEARSLRLLADTGDAIVAGVEWELPGWVLRQVARILDAWGRLEPPARAEVERGAIVAAGEATARVVGELRRMLVANAAEQTATPLQIVRSAYREPTVLLAAAGIPPVERGVRRAGLARRCLWPRARDARRSRRSRSRPAAPRVGYGQGGRAARA